MDKIILALTVMFGLLLQTGLMGAPAPIVVCHESQENDVATHGSYVKVTYATSDAVETDDNSYIDLYALLVQNGIFFEQVRFDEPVKVYLYVPPVLNNVRPIFRANGVSTSADYADRTKHIKLAGFDPATGLSAKTEIFIPKSSVGFGGIARTTEIPGMYDQYTKDIWSFEDIYFTSDGGMLLNYGDDNTTYDGATIVAGFNSRSQKLTVEPYEGELLINRCYLTGFNIVIRATLTPLVNMGARAQNCYFVDNGTVFDYSRMRNGVTAMQADDKSFNYCFFNTFVRNKMIFLYEDAEENWDSNLHQVIKIDFRSNILDATQSVFYAYMKTGSCTEADEFRVVCTKNIAINGGFNFFPASAGGSDLLTCLVKDPAGGTDYEFIAADYSELVLQENYFLRRDAVKAINQGDPTIVLDGLNDEGPQEDYYLRNREKTSSAPDIGAAEYYALNPPGNIFYVNNSVSSTIGNHVGVESDPFKEIFEVFEFITHIKADNQNPLQTQYTVRVAPFYPYAHFSDNMINGSDYAAITSISIEKDMTVDNFRPDNPVIAKYVASFSSDALDWTNPLYYTNLASGKISLQNMSFTYDDKVDPAPITHTIPLRLLSFIDVDNSASQPVVVEGCDFYADNEAQFEYDVPTGFHNNKTIGSIYVLRSRNIRIRDCNFFGMYADYQVDVVTSGATAYSQFPAEYATIDHQYLVDESDVSVEYSSLHTNKYCVTIQDANVALLGNQFFGSKSTEATTPETFVGCGLNMKKGIRTTKVAIMENDFIHCNKAISRTGTGSGSIIALASTNSFFDNGFEYYNLNGNDLLLHENLVPGRYCTECNGGSMVNLGMYYTSETPRLDSINDIPLDLDGDIIFEYNGKSYVNSCNIPYSSTTGLRTTTTHWSNLGSIDLCKYWLFQNLCNSGGGGSGRNKDKNKGKDDNLPYYGLSEDPVCGCITKVKDIVKNGLISVDANRIQARIKNDGDPQRQPTYRRDYIFQSGNVIDNFNFEMVVAEGDVIVPEYWTTSNTTTLQPVQVISERPFRDSYCIEIGTSTAFVQQHVILDPTYTGTYTLSFRFKGSISVFYGGHSLASLSNETENWILGTAEIDRSASEFAGLDQGLLQFVNADAVSGSKLYVDYIVLKKSAIATNVQVSTSFYDGLNKPLLEQIDDGSESVINVYHQRDAFNRDSLKTLPVKATSQTPNAARQYLYHADYFEENPRKHLYVEMAKDAYSDPASTGLPFSGNPANTNPNNADFRAMLHPFVVTTYHNDPRALVKNVGGPGYVYTHDHPVQKNQAGRATTAEENTFGVADETDGKYILEQTLDEQGRLTNIWKNGKGNVVKTQTPTVGTDLMVSTNEYFLASDLVKKTVSPAGLEDKFYYDARKRLIRKETPDADYVEYRYDNNNNLRATQDGNGRTIGYYVVNKYDGSNRLVSVLQYNTGGTSAYAFGEAPVNSITWPDNLDENAVLLTENRYDRISEANQTPVMLVSVLSGPVLSYEKVHNIAGRLHTTIQYFNHPKAPNVSSALWYIYSYTDEGLVEAVYQYMDNMIPRKTTFAYNTNGSLMKSAYQEADGTLHEVSYEYDNRGLLKSYSSKLGGDYINMLNYAYTVNGQIEKVEFGSKDMAALYKYHIKGMVKDIAYNNTIGTSPAALFKQTLGYDVGNALFPSSPVNNIMPRFDGNVAWQVSNVFAAHSATPNTPYRHGYIYQYDAANRLTTADYYEGAASSETDVLASKQGVNEDRSSGYEYDKNGRITKLTRKTPSEELGSLSTSDKAAHANPASYVYKAGTNLLKSITNFLFPDKQDADNYIYDKNGNMVFDKSKKMVITYDYRNMPTNFLFFDSFKKTGTSSEDLSDYSFDNDILKRVFMIYDPSGNRVGKLEYANEKLDNYSGIRMFDELAICTNDGCVD